MFENQQLKYFRGGFAEFEQRSEERAANHERRLDARTRQETAARESAERLRQRAVANKKHANDNALRQAKQRLAKIERVGLGRRRQALQDELVLNPGARRESPRNINPPDIPRDVEDNSDPRGVRLSASSARREDQFSFPASLPPAGATALVSLDGVRAGYGGADVLKETSAQLRAGRASRWLDRTVRENPRS